MSKRVMITGTGGAAGVALVQALTQAGFEVFSGDMSPHAAGLYLVPASHRRLLPAAAAPNYVAALRSLCRTDHIDLLIPTVDCELPLLAAVTSEFEASGTKVLVAPLRALQICLDKYDLMRKLDGIVAVPRTSRLEDLDRVADWTFPVIAKPRTGSGGRGVHELASEAALRALGALPGYIVQAFLPGEEYSVDVLSNQAGQALIAVPRIRLKVDSGVAVAAQTVHDAELEQAAIRTANALGLTGVANLQFRRSASGVPALIEINPRFPGTMPLTVAAGVNMPLYVTADMLGLPLPVLDGFREIAMVRTWSETYIAPQEFTAHAHPSRSTGQAA